MKIFVVRIRDIMLNAPIVIKNVVKLSVSGHWAGIYEREAELISEHLVGNLVEIHHIGSTAINGIYAKPKIDIACTVKNLDYARILEGIFYTFRGELNIPFRHFYAKRGGSIAVNLHVFQEGDPEVQGLLKFRDYLNGNEKMRNEYSQFKSQQAHLIGKNPNEHRLREYARAKKELIGEILRLSGFRSFCTRLVSHNAELAYEGAVFGKPGASDVRIIFYEGPDIIGYANADSFGIVKFFEVTKNRKYFEGRLSKYLQERTCRAP